MLADLLERAARCIGRASIIKDLRSNKRRAALRAELSWTHEILRLRDMTTSRANTNNCNVHIADESERRRNDQEMPKLSRHEWESQEKGPKDNDACQRDLWVLAMLLLGREIAQREPGTTSYDRESDQVGDAKNIIRFHAL